MKCDSSFRHSGFSISHRLSPTFSLSPPWLIRWVFLQFQPLFHADSPHYALHPLHKMSATSILLLHIFQELPKYYFVQEASFLITFSELPLCFDSVPLNLVLNTHRPVLLSTSCVFPLHIYLACEFLGSWGWELWISLCCSTAKQQRWLSICVD